MARRGPYQSRRRPNYNRRDNYPISQELDTRVMDLEHKSVSISLRSNSQGYFFSFLESQNSKMRAKVTMSSEKAEEFRSILNEFVAEYERLPAEESYEDPKQAIKTESFSQGRRTFYVDLRQNNHGRFLKLTVVAGRKMFVAIPGNYIAAFRDNLVSLLDDNADKFEEEPAGEGEKASPPSRAPPPQQASQSGGDGMNDSREVRAGNKKFFFDVAQNSRGIYIQLTEMQSGRRNRINVPQEVWEEMGTTFSSLAKDYPMLAVEESTSED